MMTKLPSISVVVTTYNWPQALAAVLRALAAQHYPTFEVIVADDGSDHRTQKVIEQWQQRFPCSLKHVWQEDKGFRAAKVRNLAIMEAQYDFIVFLDGDCLVPPNFIHDYAALAEKNYFVSGNRVLLQQEFSESILLNNQAVEHRTLLFWLYAWLMGKCNRFAPLLKFPLGSFRYRLHHRWEGVKTCNLGVWKKDLYQVNGLDEAYTGWGYEDSDLIVRLFRAGIQRKDGRFALPVFHIWHPMQSREEAKENFARLADIQNSNRIKSVEGLDQYLDTGNTEFQHSA